MLLCAPLIVSQVRLLSLILIFTVALTANVYAQAGKPAGRDANATSIDLSAFELRRVYDNNFSRPQKIAREEDFIKKSSDGTWGRIGKPDRNAEWIAEGWGGAVVSKGKLRVAPYPFDSKVQLNSSGAANRSHMVVWN